MLVLLSGFSIAYPSFAENGNVVPLLIFTVWGAVYCAGGFAIRRRVWGVRWWICVVCVMSVIALFISHAVIAYAGIILNIAILALVINSWKTLAICLEIN